MRPVNSRMQLRAAPDAAYEPLVRELSSELSDLWELTVTYVNSVVSSVNYVISQ